MEWHFEEFFEIGLKFHGHKCPAMPLGIKAMTLHSPSVVPWAWGVNVCSGVMGVIIGKLIAVSLGFRSAMLLACLLIVGGSMVAGIRLRRWRNRTPELAGDKESERVILPDKQSGS